MLTLKIKDLYKNFGSTEVLKKINLEIEEGSFLVLLGPSGCGKSTLLNIIAGLETIDKGAVLIDDYDVSKVEPKDRNIAMVFQSYALYPHMNVYENMSFGLKIEKKSKEEIETKVMQAAKILKIEELLERKPKQLSGGQRQRVAIARALAIEPEVLLLDEPLSALDLKLRQKMRTELRAIQKRVGITFIYITHDQGEALTMSDRVAVMNEGELEQVGLCGDVYDYPNTPFVATFVGENNPFYAKVLSVENNMIRVESQGNTFLATAGRINEKQNHSFSNGDEVIMFIRPESIFIKNENNKLDNVLSAKVVTIEFEGNLKNIYLKMESNMNVRFSVPNAVDTSELSSNKEVELTFSSQKAIVLPKGALAVD